jgi:hypothetical protein
MSVVVSPPSTSKTTLQDPVFGESSPFKLAGSASNAISLAGTGNNASRALQVAPKDSLTLSQGHSRPTPPSHGARLLYRGALELPDSDLHLDGLSFVLLPPPSPLKSASQGAEPTVVNLASSLFESPLPLTLESQRNRTLKLIELVELDKLKGTLDEKNAVRAYVHPGAVFTSSYFDLVFSSGETGQDGRRTQWGLRVGLGDSCMCLSYFHIIRG